MVNKWLLNMEDSQEDKPYSRLACSMLLESSAMENNLGMAVWNRKDTAMYMYYSYSSESDENLSFLLIHKIIIA